MSDSQKPKQDLSLTEIVQELANRCALDLRGYKHGTLQRRLRKRMHRLSVSSYSDYLDFIRRTPGEASELLNTVLINVTEFFRDEAARYRQQLGGRRRIPANALAGKLAENSFAPLPGSPAAAGGVSAAQPACEGK